MNRCANIFLQRIEIFTNYQAANLICNLARLRPVEPMGAVDLIA
jgi:hypothetical protein